jgi:hypothetical protein
MNRLAALVGLATLGMLGAACGPGGDPTPDASVVGVPGTYTVSGVVRYEDKPPLESGELGPIAPKVSRGVAVAVVAETGGATLAMGITGDDGSYSLTFDATGGDAVHILAATSSTLPARPITVRHIDSNTGVPGLIHGFGGATFAAGVDTTNDVLVTVVSNEAGAFNIFDELVTMMDRVHVAFSDPAPVPLTAFWQVGNDDGTYYDGSAIHLLGAADDDDGFDDTVILHESGHYIEDKEGRSDSPGGSHNGGTTDPRLAWSEGFSTYWAMAVRGAPVYMDSNAGGGFGFNADTSITKAQAAGAISQQISEDMVCEILWDLGDGGATDDDLYATGEHDPVLHVQSQYLKTTTLRQVGTVGVDLVDFLDGWFVTNGLGSCDGTRAILTTHTFPYDFAGPAACP